MIAIALALGLSAAAVQATSPDDGVLSDLPVPDAVLAQQRGGVRLPNGVDANLTIQTRTAIDGKIVLQTVVAINHGPPVIQVYVPGPGEIAQLGADKAKSFGNTRAVISYDRTSGLEVTTQNAPFALTLSHDTKDTGLDVAAGLKLIDIATPVATANGIVEASSDGGLKGIEITSDDFRAIHLTGNAFGSVIQNSGSDRAIDTQTILSIDLRNAGPDVVGSTAFRVENVAVDALTSRF